MNAKEYFVVLHKDSPFGQLMMETKGKIAGASTTLETKEGSHPVIVCHSLDYSRSPLFVAMVQVRNPGADDPLPREIAVPSASVLAVVEVDKTASQPSAEPQSSSSVLH